jgi:hypothetical protein
VGVRYIFSVHCKEGCFFRNYIDICSLTERAFKLVIHYIMVTNRLSTSIYDISIQEVVSSIQATFRWLLK